MRFGRGVPFPSGDTIVGEDSNFHRTDIGLSAQELLASKMTLYGRLVVPEVPRRFDSFCPMVLVELKKYSKVDTQAQVASSIAG